MRILILCTGNSCRSQMAHGFLQMMGTELDVCSAGTKPAEHVHPYAVEVMCEVGIDISKHIPTSVDVYRGQNWDYVITVCGDARETCPVFEGHVGKCLHLGFEDPSNAIGSEEYIRSEFRRVRDEIRAVFTRFHEETVKESNIEG